MAMRTELRRRGMTYRELSDLVGMDESRVKRLLGGKQPMTLEDRDQICSVLGWSVVDIHYMNSQTAIDSEIVTLIRRLPRRTQHDLIAMISSMVADFSQQRRTKKS